MEALYGRDERKEPVKVEVVTGRGSRVEVDGYPMASGFCVGDCFHDKLELDESRQRMSWQEFGRKYCRKFGHVAEGAVDL